MIITRDELQSYLFNVYSVRMAYKVYTFDKNRITQLTNKMINDLIDHEISLAIYSVLGNRVVFFTFENGEINSLEISTQMQEDYYFIRKIMNRIDNYHNLKHELEKLKIYKLMANI